SLLYTHLIRRPLLPYTTLFRSHYGPDSLPRMFGYEYLKDVRTFALVVLASHVYRWFWRRLQGEARLLDLPDDLPAASAPERPERDRKSTRLNSSHVKNSYAVFC